MVTGDQPLTAAAIAKKVGIIQENEKTWINVDLVEEGMSPEEAYDRCNAIVIHGDELAMKNADEEILDDNDPEKGRFLLSWIWKKEVVFARTTP